MASSTQFEVEGLGDLQADILKAAQQSPKEFEKGLNKIKNKFKKNMIQRTRESYNTAENITSGFVMTQVKIEKGIFYSYFKPESKGNKNHHWHLNEHGHKQIIPWYKSRAKGIINKNGGKYIGFVPGKHLTDKEVPSFTEFMTDETKAIVNNILRSNNL